MVDVIPLAFYMLLNPIVLIPCLFVGASGLRFPFVMLLGWLCAAVGALLSFPLVHFFSVSSPTPASGNVLLNSMLAGVIAGTFITAAMFSFSRGKDSNGSGQSKQSGDNGA